MASAKLTYSVHSAIDPNTDRWVVKTAVAKAQADQLFEWYTNTLPQHFQAGARIKYGSAYTARTIKYSRRKQRIFGHTIDMVWTGEMRDEYLRGRPLAVTKTQKTAVRTDLKFPYVRKANFWQGGVTTVTSFDDSGAKSTHTYTRHNFKREMTAFNPHDVKVFADGVTKRLPAIVAQILADQSQMVTETFEAV